MRKMKKLIADKSKNNMIIGTIRGLGQFYKNRLERLEIWVDKKASHSLPHQEGLRIPITIIIGIERYNAGIRSTKKCEYIWICPDLRDENDKKVSLAQVLKKHKLAKNQRVCLIAERENVIRIKAAYFNSHAG